MMWHINSLTALASGRLTWDLALVRNCGQTTCGNQDVRGSIPLPVDLDRGLRTVCKCCIAVDDFYVGLDRERWH